MEMNALLDQLQDEFRSNDDDFKKQAKKISLLLLDVLSHSDFYTINPAASDGTKLFDLVIECFLRYRRFVIINEFDSLLILCVDVILALPAFAIHHTGNNDIDVLFMAVYVGSIDRVKEVLDRKDLITDEFVNRIYDGCTLLFWAFVARELDLFLFLLDQPDITKKTINHKIKDDPSLLHYILASIMEEYKNASNADEKNRILESHCPYALALIASKKIDLDLVHNGKTPLHLCVEARIDSLVEALIRAGASVLIEDNNHLLPYEVAKIYGYARGQELLLRRTYPREMHQASQHFHRIFSPEQPKITDTALDAAVQIIQSACRGYYEISDDQVRIISELSPHLNDFLKRREGQKVENKNSPQSVIPVSVFTASNNNIDAGLRLPLIKK